MGDHGHQPDLRPDRQTDGSPDGRCTPLFISTPLIKSVPGQQLSPWGVTGKLRHGAVGGRGVPHPVRGCARAHA